MSQYVRGRSHGRLFRWRIVWGQVIALAAARSVPSSVLYDRDGSVVGRQQMQIVTQDDDHSDAADCASQEGFTRGLFSALVVVAIP